MGGKNKQRTKGNFRPSSSGRAAELLARETGAVPGFVGFSTSSSGDMGYVPAVHGADEIDSLVDADFRMVLRKLSKRDTVTKLKAVQEFGAMCQERESEIVKGVLPYWPRIYCRISLDHDRRVREATQQAFEQLILKVRRNLAPYLKSIMGHWLIAQCDTYPPAASAAVVAFQVAFPLNKQTEALSFCKEEVLSILLDNLLKETPETVSDPQTVPEEERTAKYTRLLTSSLLAVKKLLTSLPQRDLDPLAEKLAHLLAQSKFWKYGKHKSPQIRGAFFEAVSALCECTPQLILAESSRACPMVLLSIDDTDPVVLPALWEAVLHVLSSVPDCWLHVNARKGVLPKLWLLLREGGRGLATVLYPNLLPFISKLPQEVVDPGLDFYSTFFTSIIQGLSSERAACSPSESAAIISATMECLRYSVLQNATEDEEHRRVQNMMLRDQLLPLVDSAIGNSALQNGPLFPQVTHILASWEKRGGWGAGPPGEGGAEAADPTFCRLVSDLWEGLERLCVQRVDSEEAQQGALMGVAVLLRTMRDPRAGSGAIGRGKKAVKLCFADPDGEDGKQEVREEGKRTEEPPPLKSSRLEGLVCALAELAVTYVTERDSAHHLRFLSALLRSFASPRLFQALLDADVEADRGMDSSLEGLRKPGEALTQNPAVLFLLRKVVVWLRREREEDTELLVSMVFSSLLCCSTQEEKTLILNHMTNMDLSWGVLLQIIQKACADTDLLDAAASWMKGPVLGEKLVQLAGRLCTAGLRGPMGVSPSTGSHTHSWALVSLVLSQQLNNEAVIGESYVEKIIEQLHSTLSEAKGLLDAGDMEPLVSFICDVASNFFSSMKGCLQLVSAEDLLLTLFQLCAQDQDATRLSGTNVRSIGARAARHHPIKQGHDSSLLKLRHACFTGASSLVGHSDPEIRKGSFLYGAALWVKNQLFSCTFGKKSLQVLIAAVQNLAETVINAGQRGPHLLVQFISHLTPTEEEWRKMRQALPPQWVKRPLLSGRLRITCDYPPADVWKLRASPRLPSHLSTVALLGQLLCMVPEEQQGVASLWPPDAKHTVSEVLYALQWCEEMEGSPVVVSEFCGMLRELNVTAERLRHKGGCEVLETLFERSRNEGALWSLTLESYIQSEVESADVQKLCKSVESLFPLTEPGLCTAQVLCPSLSPEERGHMATLSVAALLDWHCGSQDNEHVATANLAALHCCLRAGTEVGAEVLQGVMAMLMEWRNSKEERFLFGSDLKKVPAGLLSLNVEMGRFLCWGVTQCSEILLDTQWDFLLCSMLAWLETVTENTASFWNPWVQLFVCENCDLIVQLSQFFSSPPAGAADQIPANLTSEWEEFFLEGIHTRLLPLLVTITEEFPDPDDALFPLPVLGAVGEVLCYVPVQMVMQNKLPPRFVVAQRTNLPEPLQTLLNTLAPLLLFKARPVQLAVFHVLHKVMPELPKYDVDSNNARCEDDNDEEEPSLSPPAALMSILVAMEELMDGVLGALQVGEFAVVQPLSDESCCILGYLLIWKLILTFFKASSSQLRVQYSQYLRKSGSLHCLLQHLFRLMPENPVLPGQPAESGARDAKTLFTEALELSVRGSKGLERELAHLACSVYYATLKDMPAMVRLWWNGQDKRVSAAVDRFTSKYVSGVLSSQEIAAVHGSTQTFENMTVKARSAAREAIATYSVDDIFIELVIQLPLNYPLGSISVESGRRVGVSAQQWRNWTLQLSTYLTHQNGSIMEGLALWKNNVDKRFEGVEDCMICFSVIHGSNYSLPKKACRTCKKKFHSACLYKWFTSSNKSTCPLCRETFF
nr:E3 ubiquitin-protein ligase listerin isoform X1 [Paramormyrops kingsleyae]